MSGAVEIWVRREDGRRTASYRVGPAGVWNDLKASAAEKALRAGQITLGKITLPVVSRDAIEARELPPMPARPGAAAFKAQAAFLKALSSRTKHLAGGGR